MSMYNKSGVFDTKPPNKGQPLYKGQKACRRGWPLFGGSTVNIIFTACPSSSSSSFEKAKLTNHSTYEPEILHVNLFSSSKVVHIICFLTLLLLVKQLITGKRLLLHGANGIP